MSLPFILEQAQGRSHTPVSLDKPLSVEELPTPALVLNRPAFRRNVARMAEFMSIRHKGFRPHAKTHKCPIICQEQLAAGAVGVCVAKVGEAAAMIAAGVNQVLITSPITTSVKADIVASLALQSSDLHLVVDSQEGLQVLQSALSGDARVSLLIDLDVSMGRTGTRDIEMVYSLVDAIDADPRLNFAGVQHYAGHVMHIEDFDKRRLKSLGLWEKVTETISLLADRGVACSIVTGGGTGTYNIDVKVDAITDLQVGSYIFMDEEYRQIAAAASPRFKDFEVSLSVACTAISQPKKGMITVDGGYKAFASDSVAPVTDDHANVTYHFGGDEHGILVLGEGEQEIRLGQVLQFVTPHCDPTVNLHDYYWVQEDDGLIHSCWPITTRGCVW